MSRIFPIFAASAAVLFASTAGAEIYHVDMNDPGCSDTGAGSETEPWCSLTTACGALVAGDTAVVHAGTYEAPGQESRWTPAFGPVNSGTADSPIIFQARDGDAVHLQLSSGRGPVMGSEGRDYIVFDGFVIHEQTSHPDTGPVVVTGNHVTVQNCEIAGSYQTYLDNHCGIRIEGSLDGPHLLGAVVRNNRIHGIHGDWGGNQAGIMTYAVDDSVFEYNDFYDSEQGIFVKGASNTNITIRFNRFYNVMQGIKVSYSSTINIYQNIFRDCDESGSGFGIYEVTTDVSVYNNVIYNCASGQFSNAQDQVNPRVYNNILSGCSSHAYGVHAGLVDILYSNCNVFHDSGDFWIIDGDPIGDLDAWRAASGEDADSITDDPLFVDPAAGDFHLQEGSPAATAGCDGGPAGAYVTGDETIGTSGEPLAPECSDGFDNDGDGRTDYPDDAGCASASDADESDCGDGVCEGGETQSDCPSDCTAADDAVDDVPDAIEPTPDAPDGTSDPAADPSADGADAAGDDGGEGGNGDSGCGCRMAR